MSVTFFILALCFGVTFAILAVIFLVVPLLKGIGWMIGGIFNSLGWVVRHVFEFVGGMLKDSVRFVGAIIAFVVLLPMALFNVVIGRWSASGHFGRSMKRECGVACTCLYRVLLQRPLRFVLLGGLLEGLEDRVNEAAVAAPTSDKPRRRTGTFEGYTIVGSLPGGGSGAKLYVAEPDEARRRRNPDLPERVVIKSFALTEGSTLPQIVRESRALEAAKQLGLVFEHGMDAIRFYYVMPYHQGDHLGIATRQLHGRSGGDGLDPKQVKEALGYVEDLLQTLTTYHEGGLWHKDVKPDNIIVHHGRANLVDLGLVTPLRSAMTLTTHGTEYFRDPEMVRMALRGVKVHQVDGAKFDIYAVGAVLYFVFENTFPAHGGLSRFAKRSPESVRWIIRRAMTDYNQRYDTVQLMLADLQAVAASADPWAVKPADLPSMRGSAAVAMDEPPAESARPEPVVVAVARSPVPPRPEPGHAPQRPGIRMTNWWTGAYEAVEPVQPHAGHAAARVIRQQVRRNAVSARRAAKEQIREARARAREIQRRAREHRYVTVGRPRSAEKGPSAAMAFVTLAVLMGAAMLFVGLLNGGPGDRHRDNDVLAMSSFNIPHADASVMGPLSLLLINDHPAATSAAVQGEIDRLVKLHREQGWEVILDDQEAEVAVRMCLPTGPVDPDAANPLLRNTLLKFNLGGVLRIKSVPGEGPPEQRIESVMIAVPDSDDAPLLRLVVPAAE
ncbi:MAG: hypothetical protein IID28_07670 [Planctomycetes bacterium]|nr:hypothetical protein [Planctomycetota bacterium]